MAPIHSWASDWKEPYPILTKICSICTRQSSHKLKKHMLFFDGGLTLCNVLTSYLQQVAPNSLIHHMTHSAQHAMWKTVWNTHCHQSSILTSVEIWQHAKVPLLITVNRSVWTSLLSMWSCGGGLTLWQTGTRLQISSHPGQSPCQHFCLLQLQ